MLLVFQLIFRINYNVIQVSYIKVVQVVKEYIIYILLVYGGSVGQSKRKYFIFIYSVTGPKYSKVLRFRVYPNSVEGLADIKLYKDLSLTYLGSRFLKQRQRILVFMGHIIQFMVVNIETQYSIWLFNKENWGSKGGLAQCYKALIQVINKILLSGL